MKNLEFRSKGDGRFFPPILPNGDFIGVAHGGHTRQVLFSVRDDGLYGEGLFFLWNDITGVSITNDKGFQIRSSKYPSGGIGFYAGTVALLDVTEQIVTRIDGYTVDYCLMNRISYEANRKGH